MNDPLRMAVMKCLRQPSVMLMHPNDVASRARAALMGYEPVASSWASEMPDVFLTKALLAKMVFMSKTDADMWDACVLAIERFAERQEAPPLVLALWSVDALRGRRTRPTARGGAKETRVLRNAARDIRISGAVAVAAKVGNLPEYSPRDGDEKSACHVVSECLIQLNKQGDAAGANIGYEAVKKIWLARRKLFRGVPVEWTMGKPIE